MGKHRLFGVLELQSEVQEGHFLDIIPLCTTAFNIGNRRSFGQYIAGTWYNTSVFAVILEDFQNYF